MKIVVCLLAAVLVGAGPATSPATKPATTLYELRKQVDSLAAEVAALRSEIAELRAERRSTTPDDQSAEADVAAAIKARTLVPGMTLAEARKAMNHQGNVVQESAGGVSTYKFLKLNAAKFLEAEYFVTFKDGKLDSYTRIDEPVKRLNIPQSPASFK